MTELKPCPFCKEAAEIRSWDWPYVRFQVRCSGCRATSGGRKAIRAQAIAAWNTRAAEEGKAELVEALENAIGLIAHKMGMDTTAMVAGQTLVAREVWSQGMAALARVRGEG